MQHRPVQGAPSQNTNPQLDAIKSAQSSAISSNEKIFPVFARKLASKDSRDYTNTTQKLSTWLGSERAYYPAARPKIIELLEVALSAFAETYIQHPTAPELAQHLRQLVRAVTPFRHLFTEAELQLRLQRLVIDTEQCLSRVPQSTASAPPQLRVIAGPAPPLLTSTTYSQPVMPPMTIPGPQGPAGQIRPTLSIPSVADPSGGVHAPQAPNPSEEASPAQVETVTSGTIPVSNNPQALDDSTSSIIPSKPLPKRIRRADIPQELVTRDLDYFKSTQGQTAATVKEDPGASSPNLGESRSPALTSAVSQSPGQSPSLKKKTARMVPSRHLPRRISLDPSEGVVSSVSASALLHASESLVETNGSIENDAFLMDVDGKSPSLEKENPRHKGLPPLETQLVATSSNEQLIKPEMHQSSSVDAPLLNGEALVSATLSAPLPETMPNGIDSADSHTSNLGSDDLPSDPPSKPETLAHPSPQTLGFPNPVLPPLVNASEPPLNRNYRIARMSSPHQSSESGTMDMSLRRIGRAMTVIHGMRGKPFAHTHLIDVDLNESTFSKILMWVNRRSNPSQVARGVCISLACYRLPRLFDTIKLEGEKHDVEGLASQLVCSWPCSGRLSLHIDRDGDGRRETVVPLSPPFFLTPNRCVDVSSLLKPGINALKIRQQDDLSEYMVVLLAHRPTKAQLAEVAEVREKDERWGTFLGALCKPVVVPSAEV